MDRKDRMLDGIDQHSSVCAEIGALSHPVLDPTVAGVPFIDYTDTATLRQNYAKDPYVDLDKIVGVSAIWGDNTLLEALGSQVDHIVASHVVEHVPDLVTWLSELRASLRDGGSVRLAIPDKRYTFDFLRQETRLSDVVQSHLIRARRPQPQAVLDFHLNAVRIDCGKAWDGTLETDKLEHFNTPSEAIEAAQDVIDNAAYRDMHCWVFTPFSMAELFIQMARAGLLGFACASFHDTEKYTFEFFVMMEPSDDVDEIVRSWESMAAKASETADPRDAEIHRLHDELMVAIQLAAELEERQRILKVQANHLSQQIRIMEMSRSWRVTAPLRLAMNLIHRH